MTFVASEARRHISIEFVDKDFSRFAVYPVIVSFFLDYLHLDKALNPVLKLKNDNFSFSGAEYLLFLLSILFLGLTHIYKADDLLEDETQLAKILRFRKGKFPTASSLYREVEKVDYWSVRRLDKVNFMLIKKYQDYLSARRWLVADIDQTKKLTNGRHIENAKPCFSPMKKGSLGLRLSSGQIEGLIFSQKLEPGNAGNADCFRDLFTDMLTKLHSLSLLQNNRTKDKKLILRIDGGYFSQENLRFLHEIRMKQKLDFILRARIDLKLIRKLKQKKNKKWYSINDHMQVLLQHPVNF